MKKKVKLIKESKQLHLTMFRREIKESAKIIRGKPVINLNKLIMKMKSFYKNCKRNKRNKFKTMYVLLPTSLLINQVNSSVVIASKNLT